MAYVKITYPDRNKYSSDEEYLAVCKQILDEALKEFHNKVNAEKIMQIIKDHSEYIPKSEKKRLKSQRAQKRERKAAKRREIYIKRIRGEF